MVPFEEWDIADEAQILMANILRRPPNWKAHWLEDKVWRGLAKPRKSAIARAIAAGRPTICFIGDGQLGNRFDYAQEARNLGWSVMEAPVTLLTLAICFDTARTSKRSEARRGGKKSVSKCSTRWAGFRDKK